MEQAHPDSPAHSSEPQHNLRNRFRTPWLGFLAVVVCGSVLAFAGWKKYGEGIIVESLIAIHPDEEEGKLVEDQDSFRRTQAAILKSGYILGSALRQPAVAQLRVMQHEKNPVGWLEQELHVDFDQPPGIMRVSIRGSDASELVTLLTAVLDTYVEDIAQADLQARQQRLQMLKDFSRKFNGAPDSEAAQKIKEAIEKEEKKILHPPRISILQRSRAH